MRELCRKRRSGQENRNKESGIGITRRLQQDLWRTVNGLAVLADRIGRLGDIVDVCGGERTKATGHQETTASLADRNECDCIFPLSVL